MNAAAPTPGLTPERTLAFDMVRRSVRLVPFVILAGLAVRGLDGGASAAIAVAIVLVNLVLSAMALDWAARVSLNAIMAVALGGFLVRMGLVTLVVWAVKDHSYVDLPTLAVAVLVTHLALLAWEVRYVSASLAYPDLKPDAKERTVS